MPVPDGPGLGVTLNEEAIQEGLRRTGQDPEKLFFPPTEEWNRERSHDRQWSLDRSPNLQPIATADVQAGPTGRG